MGVPIKPQEDVTLPPFGNLIYSRLHALQEDRRNTSLHILFQYLDDQY